MTVPSSRGPGKPHFTGRAAILALVLCAISLSLAYPIREYIAERRQVDQLLVRSEEIAYQLRQLKAEQAQLTTPAYVEQQAQDRLHMCMPTQVCYVIIGADTSRGGRSKAAGEPWYAKLWSSVRQADKPLSPAKKNG